MREAQERGAVRTGDTSPPGPGEGSSDGAIRVTSRAPCCRPRAQLGPPSRQDRQHWGPGSAPQPFSGCSPVSTGKDATAPVVHGKQDPSARNLTRRLASTAACVLRRLTGAAGRRRRGGQGAASVPRSPTHSLGHQTLPTGWPSARAARGPGTERGARRGGPAPRGLATVQAADTRQPTTGERRHSQKMRQYQDSDKFSRHVTDHPELTK